MKVTKFNILLLLLIINIQSFSYNFDNENVREVEPSEIKVGYTTVKQILLHAKLKHFLKSYSYLLSL